jgi:hypothetical protein
MSEPIAAASLSGLSGGTFGKAINSAQNVSESELLLTTAASFTAEELLSSIYADAAFAAVTDKAANLLPGDPFAHKEPVPPLYPSHYAADVQHSASPTFIAVINNYEESPFPSNYSGFITQANKYTSKTGEHRASDLLVLRPSRTQPELILWPIYAKDASGRSHSRDDGGIGTAVKYNGSEKLRPTGSGGGVTDQPGILVEAAGNPFIQGGAPPQILYAFDVESKYRQLQQTETTPPELGVWLPQLSADDPANNLTPRPLTAAEDGSTQNGTSYYFRVSDREVAGHTTLEFIFKIGGLYAVRLDAPDGSIPTGWYHRLRTFAVNFQDLQRQRGGVTVLNNVINPVKGEIAALNYRITRGGQVTIQVFTMDGVLVKQLERAGKSSGDYTVSWDGKNEGGRPVARGMYFIRAVAPDIDEIRKVMVVK